MKSGDAHLRMTSGALGGRARAGVDSASAAAAAAAVERGSARRARLSRSRPLAPRRTGRATCPAPTPAPLPSPRATPAPAQQQCRRVSVAERARALPTRELAALRRRLLHPPRYGLRTY